jgi:hypothetical protein
MISCLDYNSWDRIYNTKSGVMELSILRISVNSVHKNILRKYCWWAVTSAAGTLWKQGLFS